MKVFHFFIITFFWTALQSCTSPKANNPKNIADSGEQKAPGNNIEQKPIIKIDNEDTLSISRVKTIPPEVWERNSLKHLEVWGHECDVAGVECFAILEIPAQIENLENLEELHLPVNYIRKLPPEILSLKKLRILNLTDNPGFNDLETVSQMTWLEEFFCCGCNISEADHERLKQDLPNCKIGVE